MLKLAAEPEAFKSMNERYMQRKDLPVNKNFSVLVRRTSKARKIVLAKIKEVYILSPHRTWRAPKESKLDLLLCQEDVDRIINRYDIYYCETMKRDNIAQVYFPPVNLIKLNSAHTQETTDLGIIHEPSHIL